MSEDTPRLSRREMRERGMLQAVSSEDGPTPVEVLTQTSELRLRRPSRKELREQRELNAAHEASQNAKFVEAEAKRHAEAELEAKRKAEAEEARKRAEAEAEAKRKAEAEEARKRAEAEAEAKRKAEAEEARKRAEAELAEKRRAEEEAEEEKKRAGEGSVARTASTEPRRSVFDRFAKKPDQRPDAEGSLHDRLVARTKEDQREAREGQSSTGSHRFGSGAHRSSSGAHRSSEPPTLSNLAPLSGDVADAGEIPSVPDVPEQELPKRDTSRREARKAARSRKTPDAKTPEAATAAALAETAEHEAIDIEISEPAQDTSMSVAGSADPGFPTDVTMRIEDGESESSRNSTFIFWLIILIGLLAGLGAGLVARKVLWGMGLPADSIDSIAVAAQMAIAAVF